LYSRRVCGATHGHDTDKITQPQFCYAHGYKKGDLLIIDDRASLHKVGFDYDHSQHRRLYRMLVRGDRPY
jgi:taurine dioxygenase